MAAKTSVANQLQAALNQTGGFIRRVLAGAGGPSRAPSGQFEGVFFMRRGMGVHFWGEEEAEYQACRTALGEVGKRSALSLKTVTDYFQDAILSALIASTAPGGGINPAIAAALSALRARLTTPPEKWRQFLPIAGMARHPRAIVFGGVTFIDPTTSAKRSKFTATKKFEREMWSKFAQDVQAVAVADVSAGDPDFATTLAREEVEETIDVLNLYCDTLDPMLEEARVSIGVTRPLLDAGGIVSTSKRAQRSSRNYAPSFRFPKPTDAAAKRTGFWRFSALLRKTTRSEVETSIVVAARLAGRASAELENTRALLGFVAALEALLSLGDRGGGRGLAMRVAFVVSRQQKHRLDTMRRVEALYRVRNQVVHAGRLDVSTQDRLLARHFAKECVLTLFLDRRFSRMKNVDDLRSWFERQLLA